ncbi:glyoxalase-like protein [Mycobacterium riyadhense]|uniref:Glyoxalase-like protein n=1 Tax=Mycobacterium riyadhense TaxID=486698 RepID=A0A1X2C6G8_9MYCO|nr:glyoxalase-like protein [Mycobacterium riyadhense]VTO98587.1 Glyoxalase-like domain protein [Mycobacterium riyadhense]
MPQIDFTSVAPIVPVRNLDIALARYRRLGFDARGYEGPERYGFVDRGSIQIHLTEWAEHNPLTTASSVYLYVSDADALYAEWATLENLEGHLHPPHDTPYGLREFAFVDADGTLHRIGSPLERPNPLD